MYVWDEVTAKRGSIEVASCLLKYITDHQNCEDETDVLLLSDNCAGQNKTINIILLCLRLLHQKRFCNISHVFLVPGPAYLPCDRHLGNVETKFQKYAHICTKHEYVWMMKDATDEGFHVVEMSQQDFSNFNDL